MITQDEVIHNRQNEIFNLIQEADREIESMEDRIQHLKEKKAMWIAEHHMLQGVQDRGVIISSSKRVDRIKLEDAMKRVFDHRGRPLKIGELITELEDFGFTWADYPKAYHDIRSLGLVENVTRGYYQLIRL